MLQSRETSRGSYSQDPKIAGFDGGSKQRTGALYQAESTPACCECFDTNVVPSISSPVLCKKRGETCSSHVL